MRCMKRGGHSYNSSSEGSKGMYSYGKQSEETNETNSYEDRSNWKARKYSYGYGEPDNSGETDAGSPYSQESDSRSP